MNRPSFVVSIRPSGFEAIRSTIMSRLPFAAWRSPWNIRYQRPSPIAATTIALRMMMLIRLSSRPSSAEMTISTATRKNAAASWRASTPMKNLRFFRRLSICRSMEGRLVPEFRFVEPHDVADDLGHRLEMFVRNFFVEVAGLVQRAGERRVLDNRDLVLRRNLTDFGGDIIH